jgi:hypothetical protein
VVVFAAAQAAGVRLKSSLMLGVNYDNRYLYSIRSNRLSFGAEHWVGRTPVSIVQLRS